MKVRIRLFAVAKELAGTDLVSVDVPSGSTLAEVRRALEVDVPALAPVLPHVLFAVGSEYVGGGHVVAPDSEVACIPPVSGG